MTIDRVVGYQLPTLAVRVMFFIEWIAARHPTRGIEYGSRCADGC